MVPISVCIIAKNEEKNIGHCLNALKQYPFEIVITDTGSNDHTKKFAHKYTDKVYDFEWTQDFSAARNFCISKASNDWILSIDCDEYLEPFDYGLLESLLYANTHSVGTIQIKNQMTTRSGQDSYFTMSVPRLFNRKYYHFYSPIHEQIVPIKANDIYCVFTTELCVIHSGYNGSPEEMAVKQKRNIDILEKRLPNCSAEEKPYLYFQLAQSYNQTDAPNSLIYYENALKYGASPRHPFFKQFIVEYGYALYYSDKSDIALELLERYYEDLCNHGDYLFLLALLYMKRQNGERAIALFQSAINATEYYTEGVKGDFSYYNIGTIHKLLGNWEQAIKNFERCISYKDSAEQIRFLNDKLSHPLPVSVCMIGKNEEKHLDKCLQRLVPLSCEIIFVDTGSTDSTIQIAKRYTSKIFHYEWQNDFSAARNYSVSQASNDWILIIDCDEFLENPEDMYQLFPSFLESAATKKEDVGIITQINKCREKSEDFISTCTVARFFSKSHCHFEGSVHEQILTYSSQVTKRYITPLQVFHMGYYGEDTSSQKARRNLPLLQSELENKGPDSYIYYQLGKSYYALADYANALKFFDLGLAMDVDTKLTYVQEMVVHFGYSLLELGQIPEALCLEGIYDAFCSYADFVFLMGLIYMKNGLFDEAVGEFQKAATYESSTVCGVNSYKAYYNIGVIYECTGHKKEAIGYYKKCGNYVPASNRLHELLTDCC